MKKEIEVEAQTQVEEKFSYCIGSPWRNSNNNINCYAYGNTVFHGTLSDAKATCAFLSERSGKKMGIYKLVKVEV